jgi:hypothetical protein
LKFLYCYLFLLLAGVTNAQTILQGNVYDITKRAPLEAVAVLTTRGTGTLTDSLGRYHLEIRDTDSVYFSYLGKNTPKYPVKTIANIYQFDISIQVDANMLPPVQVRTRNYRIDSLQNRNDYAKYFNYRKPGLRVTSTSPNVAAAGGLTVGFDLAEIINIFRFRRNRNLLYLQRRLIREEQDKYVDHRFSRRHVLEITGIKAPEADTFLRIYRLPYEILQVMNDIELGYYTKQAFEHYQQVKKGNLLPFKPSLLIQKPIGVLPPEEEE